MKTLWIVMPLVALGACKTRTSESGLRADGDAPETPAEQAAIGVQFAAGTLATLCPGTTAGTWDAATPALTVPEVFAPGSLRFITKASSLVEAKQQGWTREQHPLNDKITIYSAKTVGADGLITLHNSEDLASVNWHLGREWAASLATGLRQIPNGKGGSQYGVVIARRTLQNRSVTGATLSAAAATNAASYAACGDGAVTGQLAVDDFFVIVSAPSATVRDAAVTALGAIAASRGDLVQNVNALQAAEGQGAVLLRSAPAQNGVRFTLPVTKGADLEPKINAWIESPAPTGVRATLSVVEPYAAYQTVAADPDPVVLNGALLKLVAGRLNVLSLPAALRPAQEQKIAPLDAAIRACGGQRFKDACAQVATVTANAAWTIVSETSGENSTFPWSFSEDYTRIGSWCKDPGRIPTEDEMIALMNTKAFKEKVYKKYFANFRTDDVSRATGPGIDNHYRWFWVKNLPDAPKARMARVEDKITNWNQVQGFNPNSYSDDYRFDVQIIDLPNPLAEYTTQIPCFVP